MRIMNGGVRLLSPIISPFVFKIQSIPLSKKCSIIKLHIFLQSNYNKKFLCRKLNFHGNTEYLVRKYSEIWNMAGTLPGVEAARRRRFHKSNSEISSITSAYGYGYCSTSIRRSSFSLYASAHEFHLSSNSSMQRNPISQQAVCDESSLGAAAREAKKRLDKRLQPQWRSETKRTPNGQERSISLDERPPIQANSQIEMPKLRRSGSKRFNWLKLGWKSSEQEDCAVCLEQFKAERGETLMQLPCAHKFHTNCLVPWLEGNAHCPCCRMEIQS
ncbi:hypothetical protein BUALT_Bualt16G0079900 [Buddleja alternifolia]|uniref:RING-type domain-containing protein n=1 Tax=Buddleja alternifolia TaxID=168488 RepID=A0AAV6WKM0_9LAMI|nr:hypothetical protein BUALT_Bualt16G0079900 [Buddleja alternifolia]